MVGQIRGSTRSRYSQSLRTFITSHLTCPPSVLTLIASPSISRRKQIRKAKWQSRFTCSFLWLKICGLTLRLRTIFSGSLSLTIYGSSSKTSPQMSKFSWKLHLMANLDRSSNESSYLLVHLMSTVGTSSTSGSSASLSTRCAVSSRTLSSCSVQICSTMCCLSGPKFISNNRLRISR